MPLTALLLILPIVVALCSSAPALPPCSATARPGVPVTGALAAMMLMATATGLLIAVPHN